MLEANIALLVVPLPVLDSEVTHRLIERSLENEEFRQGLLENPRSVVVQELGTQLPEDVEVRVVEETADTIYLVLPSASPIGESGELSDQELEVVAGGSSPSSRSSMPDGTATSRSSKPPSGRWADGRRTYGSSS